MEGDHHVEQNQGESLICGLTAECNTELKNHPGESNGLNESG